MCLGPEWKRYKGTIMKKLLLSKHKGLSLYKGDNEL